MFGKMFFVFCQESGYDTILRVLGSNVREFLQVRILCQIVSDTRQNYSLVNRNLIWNSKEKFGTGILICSKLGEGGDGEGNVLSGKT